MRAVALAMLGVLAACGDEGGEPMTGTLAIDWGEDHVVPTIGTTFENPDEPTQMWVLIGTSSGLDCGTDLQSTIDKGVYVMFSADRTAPGSTTTLITVIHVEPGSAQFRGTSSPIVIDAIGERVTGSLTMESTDDEVGRIAAAGTFDVINCL